MTGSVKDVVVIGAGLAGLAASIRLAQDGHRVQVLEKAAIPGGRVTTRNVDGFLLDNGFQLLNPSYPDVTEFLDLQDLDLHQVDQGLLVKGRAEDPMVLLQNPFEDLRRFPLTVAGLAQQGLIHPTAVRAIVRWISPVFKDKNPYPFPRQGRDMPLAEALDRAGFDPVSKDMLLLFYAATLGDSYGTTSNHFTYCMTKAFIAGRPGLPGLGMGEIGKQLAYRARKLGVDIHYNVEVTSITPPSSTTRTVTVHTDGDTYTAEDVIVAVDGDAAAQLLDVAPPQQRGMATFWYATEEDLPRDKVLAMDPHHRGPLVNTVVVTNINPLYAPMGHKLVQGSAVIENDEEIDPAQALKHLAFLWDAPQEKFELLGSNIIPHAFPAQLPGQVPRNAQHAKGITVAGDWTHSASQEGALASGRRAAEAVINAGR